MAEQRTAPGPFCGHGLHHEEPTEDEPVFHFVEPQGRHGIAALGSVRMAALRLKDDVSATEIYSDLYALMPKAREMIHCTLAWSKRDGRDVLEIISLDPDYGPALWTCDI